jgi:FtsP/CotA-like multicopper oxidase with cupredoxin domain
MYLGNLGPVLRAVVGDTIVIHFLNRLEFNTSMHAHGVFYHKDSEGAPYVDGTSGGSPMV